MSRNALTSRLRLVRRSIVALHLAFAICFTCFAEARRISSAVDIRDFDACESTVARRPIPAASGPLAIGPAAVLELAVFVFAAFEPTDLDREAVFDRAVFDMAAFDIAVPFRC
jgi:hypothetical protein